MKRAIFVGLIAAIPLGACGSDTVGKLSGSPASVSGSYEDPATNPQQALFNPQLPLPNPSAPLPNDQAPPPNPEQPTPPGGSGGLVDSCASVCSGTGICSAQCQDRCAALGAVPGQCAAPINAFIQCAQSLGLGFVCSDKGDLTIPNTPCFDEARSAADCLGFEAPRPDMAGPGNGNNRGRGRTMDAGF